jgi:hypothetical protein
LSATLLRFENRLVTRYNIIMFLPGHKFSPETLIKLRKPHSGHFKEGVSPPPHKSGCTCSRCTKQPNKTSFKKGQPSWNRAGSFVKCFYCGKENWYKPSRLKKYKMFFCNRKCQSAFRCGKPSWNKGKKGLQVPWNKDRKWVEMSGKNHPNWQGGITVKNTIIRHSFEMNQWRTSVFVRDDYTCQTCGQRGGRLEADHIKPFSLHPELRFELSNGRTLCVACHKKTDTYLLKT